MDKKCTKCGEVKDVAYFKKSGLYKNRQKYRGECRECTKLVKKTWKRCDTKIKASIRDIVRRAIKKGHIFPKSCEVCGNFRTHAHHDDYTKPLVVRWLCNSCHQKHHKPKKVKIYDTKMSIAQHARFIKNNVRRNALGQFIKEDL